MLDERVPAPVMAACQNFLMNLVPQRAPPLDRAREAGLLHGFYGPVKCDPGHHLRMDEVPRRAAHLPDAMIWLPPQILQSGKHLLLKPPGILARAKVRLTSSMERVHQFANHVDLHLIVGCVAYAH